MCLIPCIFSFAGKCYGGLIHYQPKLFKQTLNSSKMVTGPATPRPSMHLNWVFPSQVFPHLVIIFVFKTLHPPKRDHLMKGIMGNIFGIYQDFRSFCAYLNYTYIAQDADISLANTDLQDIMSNVVWQKKRYLR